MRDIGGAGDELRMLGDIAVKVGKLETMQESNVKAVGDLAISVNRLVDRLDKSDDIARDADSRARSAHHRIDDTIKRIEDIKTGQRWLIGTTITLAGFFVAAVGLIIKFI